MSLTFLFLPHFHFLLVIKTQSSSFSLLHFFNPTGLCVEWCDRHGDLCRVPASKLSAEAGGVAAGGDGLLLPHPPSLPHSHTPWYAAQVSEQYAEYNTIACSFLMTFSTQFKTVFNISLDTLCSKMSIFHISSFTSAQVSLCQEKGDLHPSHGHVYCCCLLQRTTGTLSAILTFLSRNLVWIYFGIF